jgi:hypothetical protein
MMEMEPRNVCEATGPPTLWGKWVYKALHYLIEWCSALYLHFLDIYPLFCV